MKKYDEKKLEILNSGARSSIVNSGTDYLPKADGVEKEREEALLAEIAVLRAQIAVFERNVIIDKALWRAGAKNPVAVRALLNLEKMHPDEQGDIAGLDEAIAEIKEREGYLFFERTTVRPGLYGFTPSEAGPAGQTSKDAFAAGFLNL